MTGDEAFVRLITVTDAGRISAVYDAFERQLAPGSRPSLDVLERRLGRGLAMVRAAETANGRIGGGYVLYSLSASAVGAIERSDMVRGGQLTDEDLLRLDGEDWDDRALYLSTIAADPSARRALTGDLDDLVHQQHARRLYGRPSTPEGTRYLKRRGYVPVSEISEIWRLNNPGRHPVQLS